MRILIVGAGGVGGYFGARLLAAGREVAFLVRPGRAAQLARDGLVVRSPYGDLEIAAPPTVLADRIRLHFDLVLLSCKAYDLTAAIESFAPAVGPATTILPLLNGMRHIEQLEERFGPDAVLGGYCLISSVVDREGRVQHLSELHSLVFGERHAPSSPRRVREIDASLSDAGFDARVSDVIIQEMWEKWVFIATLAGATCLMRASVGEIMTAGGEGFVRALLDECVSIAAENGFAPRVPSYQRSLGMVTESRSTLSSSMLRDIERGGATEGDHILGDLLARGGPPADGRVSGLRLASLHVNAYEAKRSSAQ